MSEPVMSGQFVEGFVTACFEHGLDQETAASLLQKESADQVKLARGPAFAAGFDKVASRAPGITQPIIDPQEMLKSASSRGVMRGLGALKNLAISGGEIAHDVGKATARGVGKLFSPRAGSGSLLQEHPGAAALLAGGLGAGAVGGGVAFANRNRFPDDLGVDPYFDPSGWSQQGYDKRVDNELDAYKPGIYQHNKGYFGNDARIAELEDVVARNADPTGQAYLELQNLKSQKSQMETDRTGHYEHLDAREDQSEAMLRQIAARQEALETRRNAWWMKPINWTRKNIFGGDPDKDYRQRIAALEAHAGKARMAQDLAGRRRKLLRQGSTADQVKSKSPPTSLEEQFFPQ